MGEHFFIKQKKRSRKAQLNSNLKNVNTLVCISVILCFVIREALFTYVKNETAYICDTEGLDLLWAQNRMPLLLFGNSHHSHQEAGLTIRKSSTTYPSDTNKTNIYSSGSGIRNTFFCLPRTVIQWASYLTYLVLIINTYKNGGREGDRELHIL